MWRRRSACIATSRGRGSSGCRRRACCSTSFERRTGRVGPGAGRPTKVYEPAPGARRDRVPERHVDALVAALDRRHRPRRARRGARARRRALRDRRSPSASGLRGAPLCRPRPRPSARRCGSLGFQADRRRVDGSEVVIRTPTCPLRPLVRTSPDASRASTAGCGPACSKRVLRGGGSATVTLRDARLPRRGRVVRGAAAGRAVARQAAVEPGSRAAYSRRSNQCVARSASATTGSV